MNYYKFKYIYFDLSPYIGQIAVSFRSLIPAEIGFNIHELSSEAQISLAIISFRIKRIKILSDVFEANFLSLLRELNNKYDRFIIVFDEAQVLGFIKGINYRGMLQYIHNNYSNIVVILTGSMPGILEKIISPSNAKLPSFARYLEKIEVPHWNKEETIDFLSNGLKKNNIPFTLDELNEVYEELSGIPGFISYYGLLRTRNYSHLDALKSTINYAINQWRNDIEAFQNIYRSPLYIIVLKILAETIIGASWSEIKREIKFHYNRDISNPTLYRILNNLIDAGMITKYGDKYKIIDRSLRRAILSIK